MNGYEAARITASESADAIVRTLQIVRHGGRVGPEPTHEDLMGYAHGLEDAAWILKGRSNRLREAEEEAAWGRLMAL